MRWIKWFAALAALGVCGVVALVGLVWLEHRSPLILPQPTGRFPVGRTTFDWVNPAETDELAPVGGTKREVAVWIWYPAAPALSAKRAEYLPGPWRQALRQHSNPLNNLVTRDLAKVEAHSFADAEMAPAERAYPVVLLRAGLGALTTDYTTLAEDLASHGYVVVGFDAPQRTFVVVFADGRVVARRPENNPETLSAGAAESVANRLLVMWCGDVRFVVDQLEQLNRSDASGRFKGRLDMERLGMFGHSFGGAQAAEFCHQDARCRAGIDMDGRAFGRVVQEGLKRPFLFMMSDHHGEEADAESQKILADLRAIYSSLPANEGAWMTIRGTNHFSFGDVILLKSQLLIGAMRLFGVAGRVDGRRGLQITAAYVSDFFDTSLKGLPSHRNELAGEYPEVTIEARSHENPK